MLRKHPKPAYIRALEAKLLGEFLAWRHLMRNQHDRYRESTRLNWKRSLREDEHDQR